MISTITVTVPFTNENLIILSKLNPIEVSGNTEPAYSEAPAQSEQKPELESKAKTKPAKKPAADTETTVTKADVRALALKLSKAGKTDEIKAIFGNFGGSKLSDISEADYPELKRLLEEATVNLDG